MRGGKSNHSAAVTPSQTKPVSLFELLRPVSRHAEVLGLWSVCSHHLLRQRLDELDVKHNCFGLDGLDVLNKTKPVGPDPCGL